MQKATTLVLLAAVSTFAQQKVKVRLYAESGCPPCKAAIMQGVNQTLTAPGLLDIMDYDYIAWGNAYFPTTKCGGGPYDATTRRCWDDNCGGNGQPPMNDCFTGKIVCQHGEQECVGNVIENCAKNISTQGVPQWASFVHCWEGIHDLQDRFVTPCARSFNIDADALQRCSSGEQGQKLTLAAAKITANIPGGHPGTPYITVNGKQCDQKQLLRTVCREWKGTPPRGCH